MYSIEREVHPTKIQDIVTLVDFGDSIGYGIPEHPL